MADSVEKLAAIAECAKETCILNIPIPMVRVRGAKRKDGSRGMFNRIMTLNIANNINYKALMNAKLKYKDLIYKIIENIDKFKSDRVHFIYQITFKDRGKRDLDNNIFIAKWLQDSLVELNKLDDDKHVSFTFLPSKLDMEIEEHSCKVTIIDLHESEYFKKIKEENE